MDVCAFTFERMYRATSTGETGDKYGSVKKHVSFYRDMMDDSVFTGAAMSFLP